MSLVAKLKVTVQSFLFLAVSACATLSGKSTEVTQNSLAIPAEEEVIEDIWRLNEEVVLEMTRWFEEPSPIDTATDPTLQDFAAAIDFFENATGIVSHTGTPLGRLPNERTRSTMAKWNAWFEENKHTLVLTPSSCISKERVAGDAEEPHEMEQQ